MFCFVINFVKQITLFNNKKIKEIKVIFEKIMINFMF